MKTTTRNILIAVGVFVVLVIGIVGYGVYSIYTFFSQFPLSREIPNEIMEARILKGGDLLTKSEIFKLDKQGFLKTISDSANIKDEKERQRLIASQTAKGIYNFADLAVYGEEIIAVAQFGGYVFDLRGNLKRQITFEPVVERIKIGPYEQDTHQQNLDNLRIVQLEKGRLGFLSFGSMQGARVFDENGNEVWSIGRENVDLGVLLKDEKERESDYEKSAYVLEAAVGDLDNDGVSEYIVARKKDGIRAYDRGGTEKWFQPDDYPSGKLEVFDLDGDGKNELLELGKCVRDGNGMVIRELKGTSGDAFIFASDKTGRFKIDYIDIYEGKLTYSEENGSKSFEANAPLSGIPKEPQKVEVTGNPELSFTDDSESVADPKAVWVAFRKDGPKYLAVVASFIGIPRSHLYVYDSNGGLVYHELLNEDAETIAVVPAGNGDEHILVGGKDTIWKYSMN